MNSLETAGSPEERIILTSPDDSVELHQLVAEDADDYYGLIAFDPDHLSQFGDTTAEKYPDAESVRQSIESPADPTKYRFGIWDEGTMVGTNNLRADGELGSWVGKEHVGHAYAERGRALLIGYAFDRLGLDQVYSRVTVGNEASRKSVEHSGLQYQGTQDGHWVYSLSNPNVPVTE